jgi:cardiolipin synthase
MRASIFSPTEWLTLHTAVVLLALLLYSVLSLGTRQRRHPSAAIGWVIALALLPYIALPLFLVFGNRKTVREPRRGALRRHEADAAHRATPAGRFQALAVALGLPPPVASEDLHVHADGDEALQRLEAVITSAQRTLDVSTFLVGRDIVGERVAQLLAARAAQGVRVRLMVDGVGRFLGGIPSLRSLKGAGVELRLFVQPWSTPLRGRVNLRNHRKVAVADGEHLWCGGRNLASEYFVEGRHQPAWEDLSFDLRGPLAQQAVRQFEADWALAHNEPARLQLLEAPAAGGDSLVQWIPSGPDQVEDTLYQLLIDACFSAEDRIVAVTPYFVPEPALLMAFTLAARCGVTVDVVLPRQSNHRLADLARPAALRDLVDAGARVWLYPRMIHAKLFVVDRAVALAGSANLDQRSLFLNYELMVAFYGEAAVRQFAERAEQWRSHAHAFHPPRVGALRQVGEGLLRWLTFQL